MRAPPHRSTSFAAGGTFRHGEEVAKLISDMREGTKHRVKARYRENIVGILRDRVSART